MDANAFYGWLIKSQGRDAVDSFDAHVVASILAISAAEITEGRTIVDTAGLDRAELLELVSVFFPQAVTDFRYLIPEGRAAIDDEEACLRDLLSRYSTVGSIFETRLASLIARRVLRPNHLWQDLGLRNRGELSFLMERHFVSLARRNSRDMKWKKFLYRMICRDEGYTLCTAPSCSECDDFDQCFGEESGESLLAATRRTADLGG